MIVLQPCQPPVGAQGHLHIETEDRLVQNFEADIQAERAVSAGFGGSVARGENTSLSDVDVLIQPGTGCSLFDLGGLLEDLQDLLGCRVDLATEDGLRPSLRERVLREAIPL